MGGRLAPALLPLRRHQHGREPLGRVPANVAQTRALLARRGDGAASDLLLRAGVRAGWSGLRARPRLLLRGPAARRAVRAAGLRRAAAGRPRARVVPARVRVWAVRAPLRPVTGTA